MTELCEGFESRSVIRRSSCQGNYGWLEGGGGRVGLGLCVMHGLLASCASFEIGKIIWRRQGRDPGGGCVRKFQITRLLSLYHPLNTNPFPKRRQGGTPTGTAHTTFPINPFRINPLTQTPNSQLQTNPKT